MSDRGRRDVRVLYVMGHARSGSTVVASLLGAHPRAVGVGELCNLVRAGWVDGHYCSCGRRGSDCPWWAGVRERWEAELGPDIAADHLELQHGFEGLGAMRRLLRSGPNPELDAYSLSLAGLFRAIRAHSGCDVVVDSSKDPARGLALARMPGVRAHLVHLVRDPRGVAASLHRSHRCDERAGVEREFHPRPVLRTAATWMVVNGVAAWVRRRAASESGTLLRYEDLAADPGVALQPIGDAVDLDLDPVASRAAAGEEIPIGHCIAGNRLRMAGSFRLRLDASWKTALTPIQQTLVWTATACMGRRFGYRRRAA